MLLLAELIEAGVAVVRADSLIHTAAGVPLNATESLPNPFNGAWSRLTMTRRSGRHGSS